MSEENSVNKRLLSPAAGTVQVLNEMSNSNDSKNATEEDLRLHDAVYTIEMDTIRELLEENSNLVFEKDQDGLTPLHTVALAGDDEAVEIAYLLLGVIENADGRIEKIQRPELLDIKDSKGFTPLQHAARNWLPELTEVFLKLGSNPAVKDNNGDIAIHFACQGETENALKCAKLLLDYDIDGSFINMKNFKELTPLHYAVKNEAVLMVELLMRKEYKLILPNTLTNSGQSIFHFLCTETGETDKSCDILSRLLKIGKQQLNLEDNDFNRTALHHAAIKRLPRITEMLNSQDIVNVMKVDKRKRTALHYATENGAYPNGHRCVDILLSRYFKDSNQQILYLFQQKDESENTAFMLACLNCPVKTMQKYLSTINEPQFWMTETYMTLVYKQCPLAIKGLYDRAFSEKEQLKDSTEKEVIFTDFGAITGYSDPVEKSPQQETKYLKQAQWWDFETQKEILTHPIVQLFVSKKCQKLRSIIYGWITWQLIWLISYTLLILSEYRKIVDSQIVVVLSTMIIAFYIVLSLVNEIFEAFSVGISYVISWTNITQLVQILLGAIAISPVILDLDTPSTLNKNCASTGILLAYILSMRDIGKMHEEIGLVVEVLKQVVLQIIKVLLCCSPLLIGFTLSFIVLFEDEETLNTAFPGPFVKVLVMMTGEFEYNDTFKTEDGENNPSQSNRGIRLLLFLSFLICVPVAFFNLLTGFALDRVRELREKAKVGRIAKQLEHIYFIESILLSLSPLKKFFSHGTTVAWLRNRNVTSMMINGKLEFEILLTEEAHIKVDRRTMKEKKLDLLKYIKSIFGTELSPDVRSQMFALASKNGIRKW